MGAERQELWRGRSNGPRAVRRTGSGGAENRPCLAAVQSKILIQTLLRNAIEQPARVLRRSDRRAAGKVFAEVESRPSLDGSHGGEGLCSVSGKRIGVLGIEHHEIRVEIAQNAMDEQPGWLLPRVSCNHGLARFAP